MYAIIDGDHSISTVGQEIKLLLECETKSILAHDTFIDSILRYQQDPKWTGAVLLRQVFSSHKDYWAIHSASYNDTGQGGRGNFGKLGMSFFTRSEEIYEATKPLFAKCGC